MTINVSLHIAARNGELDRVQQFIYEGADIHSVDQDGNTPLHQAADFGNSDVVKFLIKKGANFLAKNKQGKLPIDLACGEITKELLKNTMENVKLKIDINIPNGSTFFITASKQDALKMMEGYISSMNEGAGMSR